MAWATSTALILTLRNSVQDYARPVLHSGQNGASGQAVPHLVRVPVLSLANEAVSHQTLLRVSFQILVRTFQ